MALIKYLPYRHFKMPRTAFYGLFLMFFMAFFIVAGHVFAQEEAETPSYTVEDIEVDITADNAVQAREEAFEAAQIKGYEMLAERFLSEEELKDFTAPDINSVSALVKDYEVTNEKLSATRYKGTYKIRYSSHAFSQQDDLMNGQDALANINQGGDTLILPFFETSGRSFLWQINPFLDAWVRARNNNQAGRAIVPVGDVDDVTQMRGTQSLNYDPAALDAMRLRYRARDVVLMTATPQPMSDGSSNIAVSLYNIRPYGPELSRQLSIRGYPGEAEEQKYNRVVQEVIRNLGSAWAATSPPTNQQNYVAQQPLSGPVANIIAQLNFSSVRQWVDAKRKIEQTRGVASVEVKSLSPKSATLNINFQGDVGGLRQSLQQVGLNLNDPPVSFGQGGGTPIYQLTQNFNAGTY